MTAPRKEKWMRRAIDLQMELREALAAKERAERDLRHMTNLHGWRAKGEQDQMEQVRLVREEMDGIAKERDALKAELAKAEIGLKALDDYWMPTAKNEERLKLLAVEARKKAESALARLREAATDTERMLRSWSQIRDIYRGYKPYKAFGAIEVSVPNLVHEADRLKAALSASGPDDKACICLPGDPNAHRATCPLYKPPAAPKCGGQFRPFMTINGLEQVPAHCPRCALG